MSSEEQKQQSEESKESTSLAEQPKGRELAEPITRRGLSEATWMALCFSVFPGAKSESILLAVDYCKARGLDVLKKPVHIVPMKVKDQKQNRWVWRDVIMPGVSELRTTAFRTKEYVGQDEPVFGPEIEYLGVKAPEWCKITVYRLLAGQPRPFPHVERFSEMVATTKAKAGGDDPDDDEAGQNSTGRRVNSMWTRRPYGQSAKVAEAGALRKAFPEELGTTYAAEEMEGKVMEGQFSEPETSAPAAPTSVADSLRQPRQLSAAPTAVKIQPEAKPEAEPVKEKTKRTRAAKEKPAPAEAAKTEPQTGTAEEEPIDVQPEESATTTEEKPDRLRTVHDAMKRLEAAGVPSIEIDDCIDAGSGVRVAKLIPEGDEAAVLAMLERKLKQVKAK